MDCINYIIYDQLPCMLFFQTELETGACAITGFKYSIDELDFAFVIDVMHLLCEQLEMLPLHGTWL